MIKKKLLLIGGGGHCHSIIDSVIRQNEYDDIGIIDSTNCSYGEISVIGTDDDIPKLIKDGWNTVFISVGSIGNTKIRRRLYDLIKKENVDIATIIDPSAVIANDIKICKGVFIGKRAIINVNVIIRECAIINSGAIIEHDCNIGAFSHISPGAVLCGSVNIGSDTHIGAGTVIRQEISIGEKTIIGAGSVVVSDIPNNTVAFGNPCKCV